MLDKLGSSPPEVILQITADYLADTRSPKIDLGVGVYKDDTGQTPVLRSVKLAETRLIEQQTSKAYKGLLGNVDFNKAVTKMVLGESVPIERLSLMQTPGGSGALRLLYELIGLASPDATIWLPDPSWINHKATIERVGLKNQSYTYYDKTTGTVDFQGMCEDLSKLSVNDVVLLHGCCHNPTGASLTPEQWDEVTHLAKQRGFLPLLDLAYQGFGEGLQEDAYGVRKLAEAVPEMLVAYSCAKNFAIYSERTGMVMALSQNAESATRTLGKMKLVVRTSHSMPPDHGAAVVHTILSDPELTRLWQDELAVMRNRIRDLRLSLAAAFRKHTGTNQYDFLENQRGMFSLLGITPQQVLKLREEHAIYMVADSRMNIAGLNEASIDYFVESVVKCA